MRFPKTPGLVPESEKMNKVSKVLSVSVATAIGAAVLAGSDSVSADTVPNKPVSQYVIKSGDTLNKIAQDYSTTAQEIANDNGIKDVNVIFAGDTITVGGQSPAVAQAPTPASTPAPVQTAPVVSAPAPVAQPAPAQPAAPAAPVSGNGAKEIIANRESGGSYTARNGQYVGKFQLTDTYLHGDYSPANQERVADAYVASRYGSWDNALSFWNQHGWY